MRIVRAHQFGPPEVLQIEESEEPQAGSGQVVIEVAAAGVAFGNTIVRSGRYPFPLPYTPGWEIGGRVIQIGPGADQSLLGKLVVARTNDNAGGYAEQVAVDSANIFLVPPELSIAQAVGVFFAGQTAVSILKTVNIKPGDVVLVTAAASGTGSLLIQLAKAAGAGIVIGAARGKEKLAVITRLGVDVAIDYSADNWVEQAREATGGKGADVVIDSVGGTIARQAFEATANGHGRLVIFGSTAGGTTIETQELSRRGITVIGALGIALTMTEQETRGCAEFALAEAAAGRLVAVVEQTYPLERAADAHAAVEGRQSIGKILLIP